MHNTQITIYQPLPQDPFFVSSKSLGDEANSRFYNLPGLDWLVLGKTCRKSLHYYRCQCIRLHRSCKPKDKRGGHQNAFSRLRSFQPRKIVASYNLWLHSYSTCIFKAAEVEHRPMRVRIATPTNHGSITSIERSIATK